MEYKNDLNDLKNMKLIIVYLPPPKIENIEFPSMIPFPIPRNLSLSKSTSEFNFHAVLPPGQEIICHSGVMTSKQPFS